MAKKKKIETEEYFPIQVPPTPTPVTTNTDALIERQIELKDKTIDLKEKGFDNNRIAAMLMIPSSLVKDFLDGK